MAIDGETRRFLPEMGGPFSRCIRQTLCTPIAGKMSKKPLGMEISIGAFASREPPKGIASRLAGRTLPCAALRRLRCVMLMALYFCSFSIDLSLFSGILAPSPFL